MASPTSSNSPAPGMFSEITTRFIVPFFLVTLNLIAYKTGNDGRLPAFNVFISLYLLSAYFRRGGPPPTTVTATSSDDKSIQKAESSKSVKKPKKVSQGDSTLAQDKITNIVKDMDESSVWHRSVLCTGDPYSSKVLHPNVSMNWLTYLQVLS